MKVEKKKRSNKMSANAIIVGVVAIIILVIVIGGIIKNGGRGWKWIIGLIIAGIIGYLLISGEILG
ncbi:MAG: hypothetical protein U5N56_00220 [Candidatus Marinimicrobia bacterium]|nr:hypothetical protein [Candidatus Neomarinimicrobiota bacterium]